jgi:hypothetical protein
MFMDELLDMIQADRNCLSHDIAMVRAKNKLKQLVSSPNTQLVNEYTALVQKEFAAIEGFIYDSKIPKEDMMGLYDALKAKYGIDPGIELGSYVSDKLDIIVGAGRELNMCPCCGGMRMHIMSGRDDGNQEYLCQTCKGTGKLA